MRLEFSPRAAADLETIGDYIEQDSPANAVKFVNDLIDRCEAITQAPKGYIVRPEIGEGIRSVAFKSYMIFYTAQGTHIRVERILHGSRDYLGEAFV